MTVMICWDGVGCEMDDKVRNLAYTLYNNHSPIFLSYFTNLLCYFLMSAIFLSRNWFLRSSLPFDSFRRTTSSLSSLIDRYAIYSFSMISRLYDLSRSDSLSSSSYQSILELEAEQEVSMECRVSVLLMFLFSRRMLSSKLLFLLLAVKMLASSLALS